MSDAKRDILNRIRRAAAHSAIDPVDRREYRQAGSLSASERAALFRDRLLDYGCQVHETNSAGIGVALAGIFAARSKRKLLVPAGLPRDWLPGDLAFVTDHGLSNTEVEAADGVLTGCALAIAETGTIVLRHSPEEGRRALTLLPDYHLCLVFEDQVVETVPEGIRAMELFARSPITTISGPSATSDIEMTRIRGVHGPRTLDVLLVGDR